MKKVDHGEKGEPFKLTKEEEKRAYAALTKWFGNYAERERKKGNIKL